MEFHQLEYFLAIVGYGTFSEAARKVNVSQPTLSHQIGKLENDLGVRLFARTTRSVQLTPAGEEFVLYARRLLAEAQRARDAMCAHANLQKGSIKIGAIHTINYMGITSVIAEFKKEFPGITMGIYEANTDELVTKLYSSEIDVAFITFPYVAKFDFDLFPLFEDRLVLLVPSAHPLAKKGAVTIPELSEEKFLVVKASKGLKRTLLEMCRQSGFEPKILMESVQVETIRRFIEKGIGVSLFSYRTARSILTPGISIVELGVDVKRGVGLAISKHNTSLVVKSFKEFVLTRIKDVQPERSA